MRCPGFRKVKLMTTGVSLSHCQLSKAAENKSDFTNKNADEQLQNKIAKLSAPQNKKGMNAGLIVLGIGMTLKVFYTKK